MDQDDIVAGIRDEWYGAGAPHLQDHHGLPGAVYPSARYQGRTGMFTERGGDHYKPDRHSGAAAAGPGATRQPGTTWAGPLRGPAVRCRRNISIRPGARRPVRVISYPGTGRRGAPTKADESTDGTAGYTRSAPGRLRRAGHIPRTHQGQNIRTCPRGADQRATRRSEPSRLRPQPPHSGDRQEQAPPRPPPNQSHSGSSQGPRPAAHLDKTGSGWPEYNDPDQLTPPAPHPAGRGKKRTMIWLQRSRKGSRLDGADSCLTDLRSWWRRRRRRPCQMVRTAHPRGGHHPGIMPPSG